MVDQIMESENSLDFEKVVSVSKLHILATEVETAKRHVFNPAKTKDVLKAQLKATATMPFVSGPPVKISDVHYYDAALSEAVPLEAPLERGYDAVLVLCSRSLEDGVSNIKFTQRVLGGLALRNLKKLNPELAILAQTRLQQNLRKLSVLRRLSSGLDAEPPFAYAIEPEAGKITVSNLEKREDRLITAAKLGYLTAKSRMGLAFHQDTRFRTTERFEEI